MTTLVLPQRSFPAFNWPRVGALSGTLSLHLIAIALLLIPPAAITLLRPVKPDITDVRIIEPPPKVEEPPLPKPPPIVHEVRRKPVPKPVATPVSPPPVESTMPSRAAELAPPPRDTTPSVPADAAPTPLAYLTRTHVPYPRDALRRHEQGTVILRVLVGADGLPRTVEIEKSSGSRSLDNAARDTVGRWTFQPGTQNGVATPLWARVPIAFDLQTL